MSSALASLIKLPISLFISASAFAGCFLAHSALNPGLFLTVSGIFLLACGGAVMNNYQDRNLDRLCERTRHRPLASGRMPEKSAKIFILFFTASGLGTLYLVDGSLLLPLLGAFALALYNLVYTPLKRVTLYAVVPGAVGGMIPPVIGWLAGGGRLSDPAIFAFAIVIGLWQLPHFWLKTLACRSDFQQAGLPGILVTFSHAQASRILCVWVAAFAVSTLCLPLFHIISKPWILILLGVNAMVLTGIFGFHALNRETRFQSGRLFRVFNFSLAVIMGLIVLEQVSFK